MTTKKRTQRRRERFRLDTLNPRQREAVCHGEGPLLVLAGAGSGKTRVIIYRIARLLREGVPPEAILGVTFTNKAAREMRERLAALAGDVGAAVHLSTFHSLGLTILREELRAAGLQRGFCIYDTADQLSLVRELLHRVRVADRRLDVARVLNKILDAKRAGLSEVPTRYSDDYEVAAAELYPRYLEQMRAYNAVDFDDLLLRARDVLQKPAPRKRWQERFRYLLVDEYQDTSPEQLDLLRVLAGSAHNVCVVGDDDQSIYAWRGADAATIFSFGASFPGTHEVVLDQNYRSTGNILAAANAVIANNTARKPKALWSADGEGEPVEVVSCRDGEDEAIFVTQQIYELCDAGVARDQIAVLYRANAQSRIFEETLAFEKIPFRVVGGQAFHERKEVRDALAYLAVAQNHYDEVALRRVINVPPRGIGPTSVERLISFAATQGKGLWGALSSAAQVPGLPDGAVAGAAELMRVLRPAARGLRGARSGQLEPLARGLFDALKLRQAILLADDAASMQDRRLDNLEEVLNALARFERTYPESAAPLADFLASTALTGRSDDDDDDVRGKVTLMTLHSAKGLEFHHVFLVGAEEELLPHRRTMEGDGDLAEERRLCYVGMTRARRRLWLTWARQRLRRGKSVPRTPSRFLAEVPECAGVVRRDRTKVLKGPEGDKMAADFFAQMRDMLGGESEEASGA